MIFSLSILLYFYLAYLGVIFVFILIALYHVVKFGFKNLSTFMVTLVFLAVFTGIFGVSFFYISKVDWDLEVGMLQGIMNSKL